MTGEKKVGERKEAEPEGWWGGKHRQLKEAERVVESWSEKSGRKSQW